VRHVVFRIERERFALPLAAVREVVVAPEKLTAVPRAGALVKGVMNLRGRVVPVIEMSALLTVKAMSPNAKVVLLDRGRRDLGLLVTDVEGIETLEKITSAGNAVQPFVRGLSRLGALSLTVLDADALDATVAQRVASR